MLRLGNILGVLIGGLIGYLASFDIDTSLGAAKVPFYVGSCALLGWLTGSVFHARPRDEALESGRDQELSAANARAEAAEAEVARLRARVAELEQRMGGRSSE